MSQPVLGVGYGNAIESKSTGLGEETNPDARAARRRQGCLAASLGGGQAGWTACPFL